MTSVVFDPSILPSLKSVIETHDLRAKKSLGQNFLMDPKITDRIAMAAGNLTDTSVTEIGPGPGGLTRSILAQHPKSLIALEFDDRAVAALQDLSRAANGTLDVRHTDALKTNWDQHFTPGPKHIIIANLPYNIATPLLIDWLRLVRADPTRLSAMILMFQREVADRIMAPKNTGAYGRLSVISQWLCDVSHVMTLPPGAFSPPPKIHSSVIRLVPRTLTPNAPSFETMENLLSRAFGHRRKMLRSNLKENLDDLAALNIAPENRAEDLSPDQFIALATRLDKASL